MRKRKLYFRKSKVSSLYNQKYRHTCNKLYHFLGTQESKSSTILIPGINNSGRLLKVWLTMSSKFQLNRMAITPKVKTTLLSETFRKNFNSSSPPLSHDNLILMPTPTSYVRNLRSLSFPWHIQSYWPWWYISSNVKVYSWNYHSNHHILV